MLNFERRLRPSANAVIKGTCQRIASDLSRFPQSGPICQLTKLALVHWVDLVLDLGATAVGREGQYVDTATREGLCCSRLYPNPSAVYVTSRIDTTLGHGRRPFRSRRREYDRGCYVRSQELRQIAANAIKRRKQREICFGFR